MTGERGFALLIVLWSMVLLTFVGTQLTVAGRTDLQLAANVRAQAVVQAAADGAVEQAVFHVLDRGAPWLADGRVRDVGPGTVVQITDEGGKVNPNTAQPPLLRALLRAVGADAVAADNLPAAILDWRFPSSTGRTGGAKAPQYEAAGRDYGPPGAPFRTIGELGEVLGMTPGLLARLAPHLSLFTDGEPNPVVADPVVRQALQELTGRPPPPLGVNPQPLAVTITATVTAADGTRAIRRATVRLGQTRGGALFEIVAWEQLVG